MNNENNVHEGNEFETNMSNEVRQNNGIRDIDHFSTTRDSPISNFSSGTSISKK